MPVDQFGHLSVSGRTGPATHDNGNNLTAICIDGRDEIEAGGPDVTGLDTVDTLHAAEQLVVVAVCAALVLVGPRLEIPVVLREVLLDGAPQGRHVPSRRALTRIRQAMRIAESCLFHPERACCAGHALGKSFLGAANILGNDRGNVIGRFGHKRQDRVFHLDGRSWFQANLGRRPAGSIFRDLETRAQGQAPGFEFLKHHVECHDLGERSGIPVGVCRIRIKRFAGLGVDDDAGILWVGHCGRGKA